ncbi:MAG TPA: bacteriohemerythrin [Spirochaetota bacterium]|nr:bacteriohemerythrin [Spirochaetota bacterium]HPS86265.1 bacteriohemerythrin [Spirochaetota bacterium]
MEYIKWTDNLSVGVNILDDEHKRLFELVNNLNQLIIVGDKSAALEKALTGLIDYTKYHFTNEESMMKKHGYPAFEKHKTEHDKLTATVTDFHTRLKEGKVNFSLELIKFLQDWLVNHIQGTDKAYKSFFAEKGVN